MKYLIVQDWYTTHGNHAGMVHMCNMLVKRYPNEYKVINMLPNNMMKKCGALKRYFQFIRIIWHFRKMFLHLHSNDEVFLLEYIEPVASQYEIACFLKKHFPKVKLFGLAHQTPTKFEHVEITPDVILRWADKVDVVMTLGHSLSNYFIKIGIPKEKISTGFHYVDNEYYYNDNIQEHTTLTAITMGMTQRDYKMLSDIVRLCPDINWIICRGKDKKVDAYFCNMNNVTLYGYLSEEDLKHEMSNSDVSVSVMEDTVGSNVITTSLAMGLVNVASNVGSISDYCSKDNSILCENNVTAFVEALNLLSSNKDLICRMRNNASEWAKRFEIEGIHKWFSSISKE